MIQTIKLNRNDFYHIRTRNKLKLFYVKDEKNKNVEKLTGSLPKCGSKLIFPIKLFIFKSLKSKFEKGKM